MAEGNKDPLVSLEEFRSHFANASRYLTANETWPHSTILLYKYVYNVNVAFNNTYNPENTWKRVDNYPTTEFTTGNERPMHAELIMIEQLREIRQYQSIHRIEVIQSYSPCRNCSDALCKFKEELDGEKIKGSSGVPSDLEKGEAMEFKITFSNFFKHNDRTNQGGLTNLLKRGIKLDIFTDENWKYFFNFTGLVTERRQRREIDDKKIFQYFEGLVALETITDYLEAHRLGLP
ncbi:Hypothetical predicted protein [Mytilus galloprovincialis]|uniref:Activation-induced cytidine deaminase AID domain-containing protein n=1 Tax=Mytilus galloprovincialis TaxID=29158 RepID=A0A8B6FRM3_MYTGA|nr:Hypothetical predicted protein [Mytilus galloprovincialis]